MGKAVFAPMLATVGSTLPPGDGWAFEPKYDGIRIIAMVAADRVQLLSRNGIDKAAQFPEVVDALRLFSRRRGAAIVLDGELVGIAGGNLGRFQSMQARVHERNAVAITARTESQPVALMAFDLLHDGARSLVNESWTVRRTALEGALRSVQGSGMTKRDALQLGEVVRADGAALLRRAAAAGWEGIMAKRASARYAPGVRSRDWLKLKLERQQEFVIGGYTEPRNTRPHLGALLLGYFDGGELQYAGHVGTGFTHAELARIYRQLRALERASSPFRTTPVTNAPAHWVRPSLIAEVRFNEWTNDGHLRQPVYLGLRTDKSAGDIVREAVTVSRTSVRPVLAALTNIEKAGGDGTLPIDANALTVSNLDKVYFAAAEKTKGDVMRYYAAVAPVLLPFIADRPLVLRRYPNGIDQPAFFQQRVAKGVPAAVRCELMEQEKGGSERRIVGGDLFTLLYSSQLGAIDVNPWHSRIGSIDNPDYSIIDLDPGSGVAFRRVIDVARWIKEVMDELGVVGALKTSGATGLHVYLPLPPDTSYESSLLLAKLIATWVAKRHAKEATVTRTVKARPRGTVYVDFLQNVQGKSVASVFSVRARPAASVSTPLQWKELMNDLDPRDFTIDNVLSGAAARGKAWGRALAAPNDLNALGAGGTGSPDR